MSPTPIFSVIIPTRHRNDLLAKCLDLLAPDQQTLSSKKYEVIVTDDGVESTAEEMIRDRYSWAKWIAGPRKGPAANRNNGAKYAKGEWLVFTDDDCLPEPRWLEAFAAATLGSASALEGAIHPVGNPNQDLAECPVNTQGGCFWSANIAIRCELFKKVNGFDENYVLAAHEDQDLQLSLSSLTSIDFVPEAIVYHPVRLISLKTAILRMPKRCEAWAYYVKKNRTRLGWRNDLQVLSAQYMFHLRTFLHRLLNLHFRSSIMALIMLTIGIPLIWMKLNITQGKDDASSY